MQEYIKWAFLTFPEELYSEEGRHLGVQSLLILSLVYWKSILGFLQTVTIITKYLLICLKGRRMPDGGTDKGRREERDRLIFHSLVHTPNGHHSHGWNRKSEIPSGVPQMSGKGSAIWVICHCIPQVPQQEAGSKLQQQEPNWHSQCELLVLQRSDLIHWTSRPKTCPDIILFIRWVSV